MGVTLVLPAVPRRSVKREEGTADESGFPRRVPRPYASSRSNEIFSVIAAPD